jgi:hypothetical protein
MYINDVLNFNLYYSGHVQVKTETFKHPAGNINSKNFNPLNAELNPIYHSLVLLGDLNPMGPCIVSIFQYIYNKMQRYTVYL